MATLVDPPRVQRREIEPLDPSDARLLLAAVRDNRLEALYSVALSVGLRKGEALGLHWKDIDFETGTLSVRTSLQRIGGRLQLVEPKSSRSRRVIFLPDATVEALRRHRARQQQERLLEGPRWHDTGLVFTTKIGTPFDPRNVTRHFKKILTNAGLPQKRFHDLRHTCASLLLVQGVNPRVVMEVLGHSQISLTMDTYSHVIPEVQQDAAELMNALLKEKN